MANDNSIRLPTGDVVKLDEWTGAIPRYSTVEWGAGTDVSLRAFNYVVGARVPQQGTIPAAFANRTATETDTNQRSRSRLAADEAFLAYSMTYEVFALDDAGITGGSPAPILTAGAPTYEARNLRILQRDLIVSLRIGANKEKPQAQFPFSRLGQGAGPSIATSGDAIGSGVALSLGTGGRVSPAGQRSWKIPVLIAGDRVYSVHVESKRSPRNATDCPLSDQVTRLRLYLDGITRRALVG
jgi:hypothetical protein